jgi:hypothetical protein
MVDPEESASPAGRSSLETIKRNGLGQPQRLVQISRQQGANRVEKAVIPSVMKDFAEGVKLWKSAIVRPLFRPDRDNFNQIAINPNDI